MSILDFLYFGEANVFQEDLNSFLAIAEEIQLKGLSGLVIPNQSRTEIQALDEKVKSKMEGLSGQNSNNFIKEEEKTQISEQIHTIKDLFEKSTFQPIIIPEEKARITHSTAIPNTDLQLRQLDLKPKENVSSAIPAVLAIHNQSRAELQVLDEKVKSMIEKGQKMVPAGKQLSGTPKQQKTFICKVCGKEGHGTLIRDHIEANHLEGVSIPCVFCDNTFASRNALSKHTSRNHK